MIRRLLLDREMLGVAAIWLLLCVVLIAVSGLSLVTPDPDDYMRTLQVRDWLAGQSWWDVTQYRINPPVGGLMHWSRLVDLPIALGFAVLKPVLGDRLGEAVTITIVPLATLGVIMAAMAITVRRLFGTPGAPVIAAMLIATLGYVATQIYPTRIDHHGWQIAAAAIALASLLDTRPLRSGALAGVAIAAWLNISIEGLPFAVSAAGAVALRWLIAPAEEGRRFAALLGTLAAASALLFVVTHAPGDWTTRWCDAVTPAHLVPLAISAAGAAMLGTFGSRLPLAARIGGLVAVAAVAGAAFLSIAPACAADPFGALDPLVHKLWYLNVLEGLPIWQQTRIVGINLLYFPIVGLIGCILAWRQAASAEARRAWLTVAVILAGSFLLMLTLRRSAGVAHLMAVPGALAIIEPLRARAARLKGSATRMLGALAAVCLPSPLMPIYASALLPREAGDLAPHTAATATCDIRCNLAPLAMLPKATMLSTIDDGPTIIAFTQHSVLAAGYHRNDKPMGDVMRAFLGTGEQARAIVRAHHIGYVIIDPGSAEAMNYAARAPRGLMAGLRRGEAPSWLAPVPMGPGEFRLWRVIA